MAPTTVVVRGGGEMASAAARLLFLSGFPVVILEREHPLAVRREVSFAEAVLSGTARVEGVGGARARLDEAQAFLSAHDAIPVLVDPEGECLPRLAPAALVDARMAKRNLGTRLGDARFVAALGPGFVAGVDVHAVVETARGPDLGRVLWQGAARPNTALPGSVLGYREERVLRAPCAGVFRGSLRIGDRVEAGMRVGEVGSEPVLARLRGRLRGLLADGIPIHSGGKVGDIDPRGDLVDPAGISDKGRAIAAGVLEAVILGVGPRGRP